ncbi:MAG: hypothetical protein CMH54_05680 [Myxococcales bacterium]|nr:hypothetical protein [Myxococcales bacterium]|tara:strand:- start:204 stop:1772 length:1569 start_codon:yes stop_codon:yes gene_type:complete
MSPAMNRRQFLRGAGGAALAIPFLPSMVSRAFASCSDPGAIPKCFFAIGTGHGGIWGSNMYPSDSLLTQSMDYAGQQVRYGNLPAQTSLSPTCTAQALTPELISKFNVLRAIDIPYRIGHHSGGYLGNFAQTVGTSIEGTDASRFTTATIDQIIAWSDNFYCENDLNALMTQRSFCTVNGDLSWNFASPATKSGNVVPMPSHTNNLELFRYFFDPGTAYNGVDVHIIDRVKQSYARLRAHPRISHGDRMRLDQHVERMFEIERKLQVVSQLQNIPPSPGSDSNVYWTHHSFRHDPEENRLYFDLMNDVIVAAFTAGISRVGTCYNNVHFADQAINDWHGQVAHASMGADVAQGWTLGFNQGTFEHIMVNLAEKMNNVPMSDGTTLLDNSLILFVQEAGQTTHHTGTTSYPIVTAGSAGGFFNTGLYVDFGNQNITYNDLAELNASNSAIQLEHPGLYYNQFLDNVLRSMGVQPTEYGGFTDYTTGAATGGYGLHHVDESRAADYAQARTVMGDLLPVITNGS